MTIYNIYIFDRMGTLLYHTNWNRFKQSGISNEEVNLNFLLTLDNVKVSCVLTSQQPLIQVFQHFHLYYSLHNDLKWSTIEAKLMYGMLFSIKSFVAKISPLDPKSGFLCYKTSKYALHYYESLTGVKFILNTDITIKNVRDMLHQLYKEIYVEYVVKNTECDLGQPIQSELFQSKLDQFIKQHIKTLQ